MRLYITYIFKKSGSILVLALILLLLYNIITQKDEQEQQILSHINITQKEHTFQQEIHKVMLDRLSGPHLPHIVLIVSDDHGYNDVGWHNGAVISPNLDKLAREGIILEQHYSQPLCTPSRGALLTGMYPFHTGLHNGVIEPIVPYGLPTRFPTLADHLQTIGYSTHLVGKWHLGFCNRKYLPTRRGFDHFYGFYTGKTDYFKHTRSKRYDFRDDKKIDYQAAGNYSTTLFKRRAVDIIMKHNKENPLFLFLPFQSPHSPLQVPSSYLSMYLSIKNKARRTYLAMVTAMDEAVGSVTKALVEAGLYNNSIIVFMSDNGAVARKGGSNWPLRGGKGTLWEGGTRVPAFIHSPLLAARVDHSLFHITDWLPTLLSAVLEAATPGPGIENVRKATLTVDGVNQWPRFLDPEKSLQRDEIVYNLLRSKKNGKVLEAAIRMKEWKYVWRASKCCKRGWDQHHEQDQEREGQIEIKKEMEMEKEMSGLFNLNKDPTERINLAISGKEEERIKMMKIRMRMLMENMSNVTYPPSKDRFGPVWTSGWC